MDLKTLQKLNKAIEARVKIEIEFAKFDGTSIARAELYQKLSKARRRVGDILDDEHLAGLKAVSASDTGDLG